MVSFKKVTLDTVCDVLNGDRGINYPSSSDLVLYGIPFINAGAIENRKINFKKVDFITESKYNSLSGAKFEKGDIVFCLRGSLGKYAMLKIGRGAPASSLAVLRCKSNSLNNKFLFQLLGSEIIEKQILSENNGSSQPNLSAESVKRFLVPLPGITEQIAISEALSDVDRLISSLQNLIEKKKAIKQGTMQELLTGKKRLPGFCGIWKKKCLCDLAADIKTGTKNNEDKVKGGKYPFFVRSANVEKINSYSYDCEAILVPGEGNIGEIFHYINGKFDCHQRVYKISDFRECIGLYIFYYLKMFFGAYALLNTVKATVDSLRLPTFQNFIIHVPSDLKEQQAIAQILSDMDGEIEQLEKKLAKYQEIKQGMMQELLSGRIRLVDG